MIHTDEELDALREGWVNGRSIDDYILEQPCSVCHASPGEPCTIRGVVNPAASGDGPQSFLYHAKRTDEGARHWQIDHSALDQDEHDRWHASKR